MPKIPMILARRAAAAVAAVLVTCGTALAAEPEALTFGIYTSVKPTEMIAKFTPVTKALERSMSSRLGRPIEIKFKVAAQYEEGINDIASGAVDFSRVGPASYIEITRKNPKLSVLAIESKDGSTVDYGIIAVREDSPVRKIEELKGKSFAFGDELSTIGRYLSQQHLLAHGITAADLAGYEYLGRHDAVGAAVGAGRFDAGALKEETFRKLKKAGTPLRELARFPNASQAWVTREGMKPEVRAALRDALFELKDPTALTALDADTIVAGTDKDFALVREAIEVNPKFFG